MHMDTRGDHVGRNGDHIRRRGDHIRRRGDHKGRRGDHMGRRGDHMGRRGDQMGRRGGHKGWITWVGGVISSNHRQLLDSHRSLPTHACITTIYSLHMYMYIQHLWD